MKKFLREFKAFAMRGNVIDLAVGVVIGGAFSSITTSLVNDIINPVLGLFTGDNSALAALAIHLPGGGDIMVGNFINAVVNFVIMAFVVFCMVKAINRLYRKKEEAPPPPPAPSSTPWAPPWALWASTKASASPGPTVRTRI